MSKVVLCVDQIYLDSGLIQKAFVCIRLPDFIKSPYFIELTSINNCGISVGFFFSFCNVLYSKVDIQL